VSSSSKLSGLHASADDRCLSTIRYLRSFQTVGLHSCSILNAQIGQSLSRKLAVIRRLSALLQPFGTTAWSPSPVQPFGTSSASKMHWFMLPRRICLNQSILHPPGGANFIPALQDSRRYRFYRFCGDPPDTPGALSWASHVCLLGLVLRCRVA
jgi:hypothetical protein